MLIAILVLCIIILIAVLIYFTLMRHNGVLIHLSIMNMRKDYDAQQKELDAKHEFPNDVTETDVEQNGVAYTIYKPNNCPENAPVIVNLNGGGMVVGRRSFNRYWNALVAQQGAIVYAMDYPLVPEHTASEVFTSVARKLEHIECDAKTRVPNYRGLFLTGDSAGGFVCFYTAAMIQIEELAQKLSVIPAKVQLSALGLYSGMFYTTAWDKIGLAMPRQIWGNDYKKTIGKYVDPQTILSQIKLPKMYITTSQGDFLKNYTLRFYDIAKATAQDIECRCYDSRELVHAFQVFMPEREESKETAKKIVELAHL